MRILVLALVTLVCVESIRNVRIPRSKSYEPHTFTSCFEDLGCIDTTDKWYHEKYRPKNLEPLDRHTIRTEFLLMKNSKNNTNELVYDVMSLKKETIEVAGFKCSTCTIFVIHDFTSNGYTGWIKHLVIAFGKKTDCNIISIDWQAGAEPPFEQAIANARVVALESKLFITLLMCVFGQSTDNVHLIGHGVGAHIAGYIGKYIKGVQRITGLDPTGAMFEHMPREVRLDVSDAKYVEILHTDAFNHRSEGGRITHGHADFIINNADHQPGCNDSSHLPSFLDLKRDSLQEGKILPACSHKRAFKYYIQALEDEECQFIGIKCESYKNFQLGKCNECTGAKGQCATFGLEPPSVSTKNNTYYLITNGKKPFCMISYSVNVTIAKGNSHHEVEGYFEMILVDSDDKVTNATSNLHGTTLRKFESGHTYKFIFYALPPRMNKIKEAKVRWNYKSKKICILCDKSITVHDIGVKRMTMKPDSSISVNWLCPIKREVEMKSGDYIEFGNCEEMYGPKYTSNHEQPKASNMSKALPGMAQIGNENVLEACKASLANLSASSNTTETVPTNPPNGETILTEAPAEGKPGGEPKREYTTAKTMLMPSGNGDAPPNALPTPSPEQQAQLMQHETAPAVPRATGTGVEDENTTLQEFKDCFDEPPVTTTSESNNCDTIQERQVTRYTFLND